MPAGYFDESAAQLLRNFRETAISDRREDVAASFPEAAVVGGLHNTWQSSATSVYRNWLQYLDSRKAETSAFVAMARVAGVGSTAADSERAHEAV